MPGMRSRRRPAGEEMPAVRFPDPAECRDRRPVPADDFDFGRNRGFVGGGDLRLHARMATEHRDEDRDRGVFPAGCGTEPRASADPLGSDAAGDPPRWGTSYDLTRAGAPATCSASQSYGTERLARAAAGSGAAANRGSAGYPEAAVDRGGAGRAPRAGAEASRRGPQPPQIASARGSL